MTASEPTVLPLSQIAKQSPSSTAIVVMSSTSTSTLSLGTLISTPSVWVMTPVTTILTLFDETNDLDLVAKLEGVSLNIAGSDGASPDNGQGVLNRSGTGYQTCGQESGYSSLQRP